MCDYCISDFFSNAVGSRLVRNEYKICGYTELLGLFSCVGYGWGGGACPVRVDVEVGLAVRFGECEMRNMSRPMSRNVFLTVNLS